MNISEYVTAADFAALVGVSGPTVANWCEAGMPHAGGGRQGNPYTINVRKALPWLIRYREQPGTERERLAKEQADKFAIDNARSRTELIHSQQLAEVISAAVDSLSAHLENFPARMAKPLSSIEDPALVRSHLQDEVRRIRDSYAHQFAGLADASNDDKPSKPKRKASTKKKRKGKR